MPESKKKLITVFITDRGIAHDLKEQFFVGSLSPFLTNIYLFFSLGMALLWSERWKIVFPLSEWNDIQSSRADMWLVVQRQMRVNPATLRTERASVQVHFTDNA